MVNHENSPDWMPDDLREFLRQNGFDSQLGETPCPECGELGVCEYDERGRPMIHLTYEDS
jgi:hypothetical protein